MLLLENGSFLQAIEGEEDVINELFETISADTRHSHIVKIISEAIYARQFDDWSMGYASIPRSELKNIEGMNDFFVGNRCLLDLDKSRAKKILYAFKNGRWRLS